MRLDRRTHANARRQAGNQCADSVERADTHVNTCAEGLGNLRRQVRSAKPTNSALTLKTDERFGLKLRAELTAINPDTRNARRAAMRERRELATYSIELALQLDSSSDRTRLDTARRGGHTREVFGVWRCCCSADRCHIGTHLSVLLKSILLSRSRGADLGS